jgi:hypothetical protein
MVKYETPHATDLGGKLVRLCGDDVFSSVQRLVDAGANPNVLSEVSNRDDSRAALQFFFFECFLIWKKIELGMIHIHGVLT